MIENPSIYRKPRYDLITGILTVFVISLILFGLNFSRIIWQPYPDSTIFGYHNEVNLDGRTFMFEVDLVRDYMLVSPQGLRIYVNLVPQDNMEFPSWISLTHIWIGYDETIFGTSLPPDFSIENSNIYRKRITCLECPDWVSRVDVSVRLLHQNTNSYYLTLLNNRVHAVV